MVGLLFVVLYLLYYYYYYVFFVYFFGDLVFVSLFCEELVELGFVFVVVVCYVLCEIEILLGELFVCKFVVFLVCLMLLFGFGFGFCFGFVFVLFVFFLFVDVVYEEGLVCFKICVLEKLEVDWWLECLSEEVE